MAVLGRAASAQNASVRITTFPSISVADARSTVTVTAEIRDSAGRIVPDGTQVIFNTTLGSFRDPMATTQAGLARAILVTGGTPGTARITASAVTLSSSASADYELLSDRSLLESAQEYAEVSTPAFLSMSMDAKVIEAAAPRQGVNVRYREFNIEADQIQLDANSMELKAKNAKVTVGKEVHEYHDLYLALPSRKGVGTTSYSTTGYELETAPFLFAAKKKTYDHFGFVNIRAHGIEPGANAGDRRLMDFIDLSGSASSIAARKAVVFPRKEVQFHKAQVTVEGSKMFKFALFQVNLNGPTPILTDQIININDNHLAINYPYYVSLKPGQTSLLRFHTGQSYGRSYSAIGGAFLDYELSWNKGDSSQGSLTYTGLGRKDSDIGIRQYIRLDSKSSFSAQADTPLFKSVFGNVNYGRDMGGFQFNASSSLGMSLRPDQPSTSQQSNLTLDSNSIRLGHSPVNMTYGLQALSQSQSYGPAYQSSQSEYGARMRFQLVPQVFVPNTLFGSYFQVGQFTGHNANRSFSIDAGTSISQKLSKSADVRMAYDYTDDGYLSSFTGKHRVTLQSGFSAKKFYLSLTSMRGLDIDRETYQTDLSYALGRQWKFSYFNTYDRFLGSGFFDAGARLIYTYASRDFGITYSQRQKRFGVQIMGASF